MTLILPTLPSCYTVPMDKLSREQRSHNMSLIHGKDTQPEILVRRYLFSRGLRFRKNYNRLPGHPDIVLPKYRTVIFVNGCFWHGHEGCRYFVMPKSNTEFWQNKIRTNIARDAATYAKLRELGWTVLVIWECELKTISKRELVLPELYEKLTQ